MTSTTGALIAGAATIIFAGWLAATNRPKATVPFLVVGAALIFCGLFDSFPTKVTGGGISVTFERLRQSTQEIRSVVPQAKVPEISAANLPTSKPTDAREPAATVATPSNSKFKGPTYSSLKMSGAGLAAIETADYLFSADASLLHVGAVFVIKEGKTVLMTQLELPKSDITEIPVKFPTIEFTRTVTTSQNAQPIDLAWVAAKFSAKKIDGAALKKSGLAEFAAKTREPLYVVVDVLSATEVGLKGGRLHSFYTLPLGYRATKIAKETEAGK